MIGTENQGWKAALLFRVVYGGIITAAVCGFLYERFLTMPILLIMSMRTALVLGGLGAFAVGCLCRLWASRFSSVLAGSTVGIAMGAAWPAHETSDVSISWWSAMQSAVIELWLYHILVLLAVLVGWHAIGRVFVGRRRAHREYGHTTHNGNIG
jgi:hypothetical protein